MSNTDYSAAGKRRYRRLLLALLFGAAALSQVFVATAATRGENLKGYYARAGNDGSPSQTAGNNIYIKFYPDRWLGMLFVPYPYASTVDSSVIARVFDQARGQTSDSAFIKSRFDLLEKAATIHIERYGYLQDRIAFECGAMSACTIRIGAGFIELIKPGIINEHIIRYLHVPTE